MNAMSPHNPAPVVQKLSLIVKQMMAHHPVEFDPDLLEGMHKFLTGLLDLLQMFEGREKKILTDPHLTGGGRQVQLAKLLDELLQEMRILPRKLEDLDVQYNDLSRSLFALPPAPKEENPVITEMREQELRRSLSKMSEGERMAMYTKAVHEGQADVIRAIRRSPGFSMLKDEYSKRVDREQVQRAQPKEWLRLQSFDEYRQTVRVLANTALQEFSNYGVVPDFKKPPVGDGRIKYGPWYDYHTGKVL